jgi:hypothetical protein
VRGAHGAEDDVVARERRQNGLERAAARTRGRQQQLDARQQERDARQQQLDARRSSAIQETSSRTQNALARYAALLQERRQQEREGVQPLPIFPSYRAVLRAARAVEDDVVGGETRENALARAAARIEERQQQLDARRSRAIQETSNPTQEHEAVAYTALLPLLNHDADMVNMVGNNKLLLAEGGGTDLFTRRNGAFLDSGTR